MVAGSWYLMERKKPLLATIGNEEAKRLVKRTYRKPYVIPESV